MYRGRRFDVLLKADQPPRAYYITSNTQYRTGSPNGYGFLRYAGTNASALPPTPTPQPDGVEPWNHTVASEVLTECSTSPVIGFGFNRCTQLLNPSF